MAAGRALLILSLLFLVASFDIVEVRTANDLHRAYSVPRISRYQLCFSGKHFFLTWLCWKNVVLFRYRDTIGCVRETVSRDVLTDAQQHHTGSLACFSARSAVLSVSVFLQALTATNKHALVTIAGRLNKELLSALSFINSYMLLYFSHLYIPYSLSLSIFRSLVISITIA